MRKSTSLVGVLGSLVGLGVLILPTTSFAATRITTQTNTVSLGIESYLALEQTAGVQGEGVTYDRTTHTYSATLEPGSTPKTSFGTSTFHVICNYINETSDSCHRGWKVTAKSGTDAPIGSTRYATMTAASNNNPAVIYSKSGTLSSTESNWQMSVAGVAKSGTTSPSPAVGYSSLTAIPPLNDSATVVSGNTFQTINTVPNTYIGDQEFTVTYGVSAGPATPADTYTGTITYTLSINTAP